MFEAQIQRGVEYLDRYGPTDWRDRVDVGQLNVGNVRCCVLGQVYPSYEIGVVTLYAARRRLSVPTLQNAVRRNVLLVIIVLDKWSADHGFFTWNSDDYERLTEEWRERLRRDREAELGAQVDRAMTYDALETV